MRQFRFVAIALVSALAACAPQGKTGGPTPHEAAAIAREQVLAGQRVAEANCAVCHAVGRVGQSPRTDAPPFRTLSRRYQIDTLNMELAEGMHLGPGDMPRFKLSLQESDALVAYIRDIQTKN